MHENNAVETALKTLLAIYAEEYAEGSRDIDNDYLIQKLAEIAYSKNFVIGYDTKKLLTDLRRHKELIRDFSNPNRLLDVMNFLAQKDSFISIIQSQCAGKDRKEKEEFLLKLTQDFSNIKTSPIYIDDNFIKSDIFKMLTGYILIKELRHPLTLEDFIVLEEVKTDEVSPKLLFNLNRVIGYMNTIDVKPLEEKSIIYQYFERLFF